MWENNQLLVREQENPNPKVHRPVGNSASLIPHWNDGPSGWDSIAPTEHKWWILFYLIHVISPRLSLVGCFFGCIVTHASDVKVKSKWPYHVKFNLNYIQMKSHSWARKRIHYLSEGGIEKSVSRNNRLSSLGKHCDAKWRSLGSFIFIPPSHWSDWVFSWCTATRDFPRPDLGPIICPFPIQKWAKLPLMVYIIPNFLVLQFGVNFIKIRAKIAKLQIHENLHKNVNENMFLFTFLNKCSFVLWRAIKAANMSQLNFNLFKFGVKFF